MNGYINFMVTFNLKLKLIFKIRNNIKNKIIKKEYFYRTNCLKSILSVTTRRLEQQFT